jgi:hypothetical protein
MTDTLTDDGLRALLARRDPVGAHAVEHHHAGTGFVHEGIVAALLNFVGCGEEGAQEAAQIMSQHGGKHFVEPQRLSGHPQFLCELLLLATAAMAARAEGLRSVQCTVVAAGGVRSAHSARASSSRYSSIPSPEPRASAARCGTAAPILCRGADAESAAPGRFLLS